MLQRYKSTQFVVVISLSLFFGLVFGVYPLSDSFALLRPQIICLLVVYWIISYPHQLGVVFAWATGFFQDIVLGSVWGAHALALTVLAYICLLSWQRIRSYSVWQQSLWIFVLVGTHQVVVSWVQGIAGYPNAIHMLLLPTVASALTWPILFVVLQQMRFRVRMI